eukprot:919038-Pelagomonas_calceolata.AAC.1
MPAMVVKHKGVIAQCNYRPEEQIFCYEISYDVVTDAEFLSAVFRLSQPQSKHSQATAPGNFTFDTNLSVIGFGGSIENGLLPHPDGRTIIYPLGSTVVLRDKFDSRAQEFLQGHSDKVPQAGDSLPSRTLHLLQNVEPNCSHWLPYTSRFLPWHCPRMDATWPQGKSPTWAS